MVVILGAGGHAKVIIDLIKSQNRDGVHIELLDDALLPETTILGTKIKGSISDCIKYPENTKFVIGIGNNQIRKEISQKYHLNYISLIHPSAVIGSNVKIGIGTVVMANVVINCESKIGNHCIINTAASVDHECEIEDYVHVSPGAHLGGNVRVGETSWIGIGACIKNNVSVSKNSIIGAGTVVIQDVLGYHVVVGNPARIIK